MFYFFLLNLFFITNVYSLNEKFCINCKHFIGIPLCNDKFGRCRLYPKKIDKEVNELNYLVSGKRKFEYRFCNFVREDEESCGKSGKYYLENKFKIPIINKIKNKLCNIKQDFVLNNLLEEKDEEEKVEVEKDIFINDA